MQMLTDAAYARLLRELEKLPDEDFTDIKYKDMVSIYAGLVEAGVHQVRILMTMQSGKLVPEFSFNTAYKTPIDTSTQERLIRHAGEETNTLHLKADDVFDSKSWVTPCQYDGDNFPLRLTF